MAPNSRRGSRAVLLGIATAALLRLARAAFLFVTVVGTSMEPTFVPGDRVIAVRRRLTRQLRVGDVVVLRRAGEGGRHLIKRVAATSGMAVPGQSGQTVPAGSLWVLGDGRESYDSRQFGLVGDDQAVGLVIRRLWSDPRGG